MKRKTQKVYKSLPPHTNEAHPIANAGQASKPFIIAVITIVAVVALTLLLLFSDRLVGKAFYTGGANTAGASLPSPAVEGQPFTVAVKANVGNQPAAAISFELTFPSEFICPQPLDLLNWPVKSISCDIAQKTVKYVAITNSPVSGEINIANLVFPGTSVGSYEFNFVRGFEVKKPTKEPIALDVQSPFTVEVNLALVCGDGIVDETTEQCDDGNVVNGDGCSSTCQTELQVQCIDSDGGLNPSAKGIVTGGFPSQQFDDACEGDGYVQEWYCLNNLPDEQSLTCPSGSTCQGGACRVVCGNGVVNSNEQCDDGNVVNGDGCSATCQTEQQQICSPNQWSCEGLNAKKQCKSDGSGYNTPVSCAVNEFCEAGVCSAQLIQPLIVQGTKITLTDADTEVPALVATKVTPTVSFSTEITVYTVLYGQNNKVLSIKSEKIETGLALGTTYLATVNYPMTNVKSKSVIVYDVEQNPTVFGQLQKSYE
ncbi:MAG: myxococcus cysteine-rich repeat containing protein [Nanoarchaeota archaeon]